MRFFDRLCIRVRGGRALKAQQRLAGEEMVSSKGLTEWRRVSQFDVSGLD